MAIVLSIETATRVCSVALHNDGKLLAVQNLYIEKSHAERLAILIENILDQCSVAYRELAAVAVSKGPGSYTGLRIGTSTAKGLCFALDIPFIAVNTLEAMASGMQKYNIRKAWLCPALDARRMEIYCLVADHELNIISETMAKVIDKDAFSDILRERDVLFFGDGAAKCEPLIGRSSRAFFVHDIQPTAADVGKLAAKMYRDKHFEDLAYFEPYYLKDFKAIKPKVR